MIIAKNVNNSNLGNFGAQEQSGYNNEQRGNVGGIQNVYSGKECAKKNDSQQAEQGGFSNTATTALNQGNVIVKV